MIIRMRLEKFTRPNIMDETPINFDTTPSRTVNPVGEKTKALAMNNKKVYSGFSLSSRWYQVEADDHLQKEDHAKRANSTWSACTCLWRGLDGRRRHAFVDQESV